MFIYLNVGAYRRTELKLAQIQLEIFLKVDRMYPQNKTGLYLPCTLCRFLIATEKRNSRHFYQSDINILRSWWRDRDRKPADFSRGVIIMRKPPTIVGGLSCPGLDLQRADY